MESIEVWRYYQLQLTDVGNINSCDFALDFCVVCLVNAHSHLISSSAKESIQEKGAQFSAKFSI